MICKYLYANVFRPTSTKLQSIIFNVWKCVQHILFSDPLALKKVYEIFAMKMINELKCWKYIELMFCSTDTPYKSVCFVHSFKRWRLWMAPKQALWTRYLAETRHILVVVQSYMHTIIQSYTRPETNRLTMASGHVVLLMPIYIPTN